MKKLFLVLAAVAATTTACRVSAQDQYSFVLHGASHHTKPRPSGKEWNQFNAGIGLRLETANSLSYQAGIYRDSVFKNTAYGLVNYTPVQFSGLTMGGFVGAKHNGSLTAIVGALIKSNYATLRIAPAPQSKGLVYAVEFTIPF
jgi:hypothetical protein